MTPDRVALLGVRFPDGSIGDLHLEGSAIADPSATARRLDASGYIVLPRLCDPHVHLDKTFVGGAWHPHQPAEDLGTRINQEIGALADASERAIADRAISLAHLLVSKGSTLVRSHVDVSASVGLTRLEAVLEARERVADLMEITLVAFPQEGILACPGTMELLDEALRLGVETIGGLDPDVFDGDRTAHLDLVFSLAAKYDRSVDIHLHESGVGGLETMRGIAARTDSFGLSGRVCISHGFALATAPADQVATTIELLGETGVGLITSVPGEGLMPPIDRLLDGGVRVAVGSDNIRDSWSPFGRGDQLERSALAAYMVGWRSDAELERSFGLASAVPAELLGAAPAALRVGDPADFALIRAESVSEAIVSAPEDRIVYHLGHHVVGSPLKATLS